MQASASNGSLEEFTSCNDLVAGTEVPPRQFPSTTAAAAVTTAPMQYADLFAARPLTNSSSNSMEEPMSATFLPLAPAIHAAARPASGAPVDRASAAVGGIARPVATLPYAAANGTGGSEAGTVDAARPRVAAIEAHNSSHAWQRLLRRVLEEPAPARQRLGQLGTVPPPAYNPNTYKSGWSGLVDKLLLDSSSKWGRDSSAIVSSNSDVTGGLLSAGIKPEVVFKVPAVPMRPRRPKLRRENPLAIIAYGPAERMVWRQRGLTYVAAMR